MAPPESCAEMTAVLGVILGGGRGTRLYPLTKDRAKPAMPIGGRYRLVDIPLSNCINSGLRRIYVLTQFNSVSLHRHIHETYKLDAFSGGYVEILAAQQTGVDLNWFEGTADAVRQNRRHLDISDAEQILILSGDQLYRMDFRDLVASHVSAGAEVTVAALPVARQDASGLGILQVDASRRIVNFVEKPQEPAQLDALRCDPEVLQAHGIEPRGREHLASMGIYLFEKGVLFDLLAHEQFIDFGREVFPHAIGERRVHAHLFDGYWQDIGTMRSFYETNLSLTDLVPPFDLYDSRAQIFTRPRFLPPTKIQKATIENSILAEGAIVDSAEIRHAIIGLRTVVREGAVIRDSILMGADYYEDDPSHRRDISPGMPPLGIGRGTRIRNAIIDKNARIGESCVIENARGVTEAETESYTIRDGIVVVPRKAVLPPGTVI